MAKLQNLEGSDLAVLARNKAGGTPQRGEAIKPQAKERSVPLQLKVPAGFARAFKSSAALHEQKLNVFIQTCFESWQREQG